MRRLLLLLIGLALLPACDSEKLPVSSSSGSLGDPLEVAVPPQSCAFECPLNDTCAERTSAYSCPSLKAWNALPHESTCPTWNGQPPVAVARKCSVTGPSGEAIKYAGVDPNNPKVTILPGGARLRPAGKSWVFDDAELPGGMTTGLAAIPGTSLVLTVDTSAMDHGVRLVDMAQVDAEQDPVLARVIVPRPDALNWGIAFVPPNRAFVATNNGVVMALDVDIALKTLAKNDAKSIALPPSTGPSGAMAPWFVSGVAVSPTGKRLVVSAMREQQLLVYDVDPSSTAYGMLIGTANLGERETFGVYFDAHDPTGRYAYVSMWNDRSVVEVDLDANGGPAATRTFSTGKAPAGIAFLDERWMVVANGLGDGLTIVDRSSGSTYEVPIDGTVEHGMEPTTLDYDPVSKQLYVALAGISAIMAHTVDLSSNPPTIAPIGRLPTLWWPTAVAVQSDGGVVVTSLRGEGDSADFDAQSTRFVDLTSGVQRISALTAGTIATLDAQFEKDSNIAALPGHPTLNCPAGTKDFPIPETNTEGPSSVIEHVFIIVRENKTFDALLGDLPNVNGDPALTLVPDAKDRERIWVNLRALAGRFSVSDNFYTAAEVSIVGHTWATLGRSTDFVERTWPQAGFGRQSSRVATEQGGVYEIGIPEEGGLFDWLALAGITHDILGENQGLPKATLPDHTALDFNYPGGFVASVSYPDNEKACYVAGRLRVLCNLGKVVYMTLANDHTEALKPGRPVPEVMIAMNDEATGMTIDALSKSPYWPSSVVFVYEDDAASGSDHVSAQRTLMLVASPWVKRGYVSKTNVDVSSIHKLIAHVYGLPYPNIQVARAGLPLDLFTNEPDYTPFDYLPRQEALACNASSTKPGHAESDWDVSEVDRNPELDAEVTRWLRRNKTQPRENR